MTQRKPPLAGARKGGRVKSTSGEKAALKLALEMAPPPEPLDEDANQIDWVDELIGPGSHGAAVKDIRARIGRPPGARNKRTVEFAEYLLNKYTSPAEGLLQIAAMSIEELVAATGCTRLEALQEKRLSMIPLLPYLHSKMPVSIDITNRKVIYLHIGGELTGAAPPSPEPENLIGVGLTATVIEGTANASRTEAPMVAAGAGGAGVHVREETGSDH
jgi:hypothetical protein